MAIKKDNNLFKVTDLKTGKIHWYTSLQRIADSIGVQRTTLTQALWKNDCYKDIIRIQIEDGSEVLYKDIN